VSIAADASGASAVFCVIRKTNCENEPETNLEKPVQNQGFHRGNSLEYCIIRNKSSGQTVYSRRGLKSVGRTQTMICAQLGGEIGDLQCGIDPCA
jgi:hypothetical protein